MKVHLGLGCVNLGDGTRHGIRMVHHALGQGIRFFDTADTYGSGRSERVLGQALRGRRQEAFIATKAGYLFRERSALTSTARSLARSAGLTARRASASGSAFASSRMAATNYAQQDFSPKYVRAAVEGSLRRLGTDMIDLYQLHGPRSFHEDLTALMADLKSEGKILEFGIGFEDTSSMDAWISTGALDSIQVPFGVLDPQTRESVIPAAAAAGLRVVVRGVLAGGFVAKTPPVATDQLRPGQPARLAGLAALAGRVGVSPMQLATWFARLQPGVSAILVGTSNLAHLDAMVECMETSPPGGIMGLLDALIAETPELLAGTRES